MDDKRLERQIDNARGDLSTVLDSCIEEIERLENIVEKQYKEIQELNEKIEDLSNGN